MKQLLALLFLVFVFFGCTQKQVVEIRMPNKTPVAPKVAKPVQKDEDTVTVVEEFVPVDIKESDTTIKETTVPTEKLNSNDSEKIKNYEQNFSNETEIVTKKEINIEVDSSNAKMQVAFVYPSKLVEKYAKGSLNAISGYLSYQKAEYNLVVIDCENESYDNISSAFSKVKQQGITKIVGLFTPNAIGNLNKAVSSDLKVFLPLIEKKDSPENNNSLIFGSISYDDQLKKLSYYSTGTNAMFYQDSYLGLKLKKSYDSVVDGTGIVKEIGKNDTNFKNIAGDARLNNASLFLNTDTVKTALILSQMRSFDISPKMIFSTQLNYDQALMGLTQDKDRERLVIANSIDKINPKLKDEIANFGGNVNYEWVEYATLVGINYLYNGGNSSLIPTQVVNNQAMYNPRLYKSTEVGFLEIK